MSWTTSKQLVQYIHFIGIADAVGDVMHGRSGKKPRLF